MKLWILTIQGREFIAPGCRKFEAAMRASEAAGIVMTAGDDLKTWWSAREVKWNAKLGMHEEKL